MSIPEVVFVDHSAELIQYPAESPSLLIARAARVSTQRETDPETCKTFVKSLMRFGHWSCFEFADFTWRVTTMRAVATELRTHRHASFMQESQRRVRYEDGLRVIVPEGIRGTLEADIWKAHMRDTYDVYLYLLEKGVRPEDARTVLPLATAANLVVHMNLREVRHILSLRTDRPAWREMRILADRMAQAFADRYPDEVYLIEDVWHREVSR